MATQFTATVKPSGGDYPSMNTAGTGLQNDLTAADIKVFSISAYSTPTIAAGDTVLGQTSSATGVCVLVNAARTQILIKTIAVASFLNTEIVQKTADANVNVTLSNAGDSPIIGIECYSMSDTTQVTIYGWTTGINNYIYIYTPISERHDGKWNTGKYRLEVSTNSITLSNYEAYVWIDGLQISVNNDTNYHRPLNSGEEQVVANEIKISNNILKIVQTTPPDTSEGLTAAAGINTASVIKIWNNIIYDIVGVGSGKGIYINSSYWTAYIYNNTIIDCTDGIYISSGTVIAKNNIVKGSGDVNTYIGTFALGTDYNSTDGTDTGDGGPHSLISQTFSFVAESSDNFHLAPNDTGARNQGIDLSIDLYLPFSTDIDGQTRPGQLIWDIGADEYFPIKSYGYIIT